MKNETKNQKMKRKFDWKKFLKYFFSEDCEYDVREFSDGTREIWKRMGNKWVRIE